MYTGLPAFKIGFNCSRCARPSTLINNTASTRFKTASGESITSTPSFWIASTHFGNSRTLSGMSGLPALNATTTLMPAKSPTAFGLWKSSVNATAW